MKDMTYPTRHGLKTRLEKKAALGPGTGIRQESQDRILALRSQKGREGVAGEFHMAASVILNNSKSKDERTKGNISLEGN